MMSAIEGDHVCACKAMLYKTAIVTSSLAEGLPKVASCKGICDGSVVAIQFAWRLPNGEPMFYFGLTRGRWIGSAPEHVFRDFVL